MNKHLKDYKVTLHDKKTNKDFTMLEVGYGIKELSKELRQRGFTIKRITLAKNWDKLLIKEKRG